MSLFRKPKKNVRTRGPIEVEEEEEDIEILQSSIGELKEKKKKKKDKKDKDKDKSEKKTSLLSFDDEEGGGEEFKVKKSSASRKLMKQKKDRIRDDEERPVEPPAQDTVKKKESNLELIIKNTSQPPPPPPPPQQKKTGTTWTLSGKEAEALHAEEEDAAEDSDEEDPIQKIIQRGGIPDAAAIHAARKKREAMRAKGGTEDVIPLKSKSKRKEVVKEGKRLLREEEEEEEDDEERISFTLAKNSEEYHRKVGKNASSDEEDDVGSWEKMQIMKAGVTGIKLNEAKEEEYATGWFTGASNTSQQYPTSADFNSNSHVNGNGTRHVPNVKPLAKYDLKGIRDRMAERVAELKQVSRQHESDCDKAVDDLVTSQSEILKLEEDIPRLSARYKMFQQMRGYFTDLEDCYNEKVGTINYMESRLNKMKEERRGKLRERRRQDVRDQADILHTMGSTNANVTFDPVNDAVRDFRVAEREGRQRRRRQARANKNVTRHCEGLSSDDEMPGQDEAQLVHIKKDVENQARVVLEDVIEEFATLSTVMEKAQDWRHDDRDSYNSAYVSLVLPKLFSPLIRMQMLFWNPFSSDQSVQEMEWYSTLALYGLYNGEDLSENMDTWSKDPDRNLVSSCVEKVVLPKLAEIVRTGYDPVSTSQTVRLIGVLNSLVRDFPTVSWKSKHLRLCLSHVTEQFKDSLDHDVYIPMYTKALMEYPHSVHLLFFQRQFYTALKLFKNIVSWDNILADNMLAELALDSLLNRYLLLSLRANNDTSDAIDKARVIVDWLPPNWLSKSWPHSAKFGMLLKFLESAGSTSGLPRDAIQEAVRIAKKLGGDEVVDKLKVKLI